MQSAALRHLQMDQDWGLNSKFNVFFEKNDPKPDQVHSFGWSGKTSIHSARKSFREVMNSGKESNDLSLYYNFWGAPLLADLDRSRRRVGVLHSPWVGIEDCLRGQRGLMDGALCINQPLVDLVLQEIPELGPDRVRLLPVAIRPHPELDVESVLQRPAKKEAEPWVVGVCGRVSKEQKRVDRLPEFCDTLERLGIPYRLEILGSGPELGWLQSKMSGRSNVVFHGTQRGLDYWKTLANWDSILFVSDYEGIPIALMECMALGIVPLYPDIGSGAESYLKQVDEDCIYSACDFEGLAERLKRIQKRTDNLGRWINYKKSFRKPIAAHLSDQYDTVYQNFVGEILNKPSVSTQPTLERAFDIWDFLPFGLLKKIHPASFYRSGIQ